MTRPLLLASRPRAAALAAPLLALGLSLTACGGGDTTAVAGAGAAGSPSTAPSTAPSATTAPTAVASSSAPSGRTTAAASAARSAGAAPRRAAPGAPGVVRSSAPAAARASSLATRAGRYTYDSKGTVTAGGAPRDVSGTATLTVDKPVRDTQSTVLEGDQGRTETDTRLEAAGRYVTRLLLTTPAFSKEFRPSPAALLLPEPPAVGRSWSWKAISTDGKTRVTATNRVLRTETVTVGGTRVSTRVVETKLVLRGDVVYDGTTTTDVAPEQRLPVREHGVGKGTVSGIAFSTDTTSTLRSLDPA